MLIVRAYWLAIALWVINGVLFISVLIPTPLYITVYKQAANYAHQHCESYDNFAWAVDALFSTAFWTAAATLAIACFTYWLKQSTDRLWEAGEKQRKLHEDTAERQLRAYVSVYNGNVSIVKFGATETFAYKLSIELRNFGQTPARKYTTWIDNAVRNVDDFALPLPSQ